MRTIACAVLLCIGVPVVFEDDPISPLEQHSFLKPYAARLKADTSASDLDSIARMRREDLIVLHHGYGTGIRNKWLWGDREPALVEFFRKHGVTHPDEMSMVLIYALWREVNSSLTPAERSQVEQHRRQVVARRQTYRRVADECTRQIVEARPQFEECFRVHGRPGKYRNVHEPFFAMVVAPSGQVRKVKHWEGGSKTVRSCLAKHLASFQFSPFSNVDQATLHTTDDYRCTVAEQLNDF